MSLYLKYRPRSFADVVGQEHIVTTLEHAVERDQLVHAYMFFGPRGTGKTSVARILAKILLIRGIEDETVQKQILKSVDEGTMVDLIEIDAASNRGIDDVRDLKEKVEFAPNVASAKIYIIDEVHMMTKEAFNALLKTLEEPPSHAFFILATTEPHKVPDTIRSRCQCFPFREIGEDDIVRALQNIADKERITIDRGALRAIARHVGGSMRDANSLLDQLSSLEKVEENDVRLRIGESADEYVDEIWKSIAEHDGAKALTVSASLEENGVSLEVFLRQLLTRARENLHNRIAEKADITSSIEHIDVLLQSLKDIRIAPVPAVALEVALVRLCRDDVQNIQQQKTQKKADRKTKKEEVKASVTKEVKEEKKDDSEKKTAHAKSDDATIIVIDVTKEEVTSAWGVILAAVSSPAVRMSLKDAVIDHIEDGSVVLAFSSTFHRDNVNETKARMDAENAFAVHFKTPVPIKCILKTGSDNASPKKEEGDAVNMVEAVAEIFG